MKHVFYNTKRFIVMLSKSVSFYRKFSKAETEVKKAKEICKFLESLGPTFIKFGQVLSLRPDLIPIAYCEEFEKLFEYLPPCPKNHIEETVEEELRKPISKLFKSFNKKPLSCASIGQVHKAKLFSGETVAVKIQRPHLRKLVTSDVRMIKSFIWFLKLLPRFSNVPLEEAYNYFAEWMHDEIDYEKEARNTELFYRNFKNSRTLKIPKLYKEYCTNNILTTEYIEGTKFSEILRLVKAGEVEKIKEKGINLKKVIKNFESDFLKQMLVFGFFQADPHPANIFVLKGNKIAQIDFGIVGYINRKKREIIAAWLDALAANNAERSTRLFIAMSTCNDDSDTEKFEEEMGRIMDEWQGTTVGEKSIAELAYKIVLQATKNGIKPPVELILVIRGMVITVGVTRQLFPDWSIFQGIKNFMKKFHTKKIEMLIAKDLTTKVFSTVDWIKEVCTASKGFLDKVKDGKIEVVQAGAEDAIKRSHQRILYVIAIFILFALLTYSFILVRFDLLFKEFSISNVLLIISMFMLIFFFFYLLHQARKLSRR